MSDEKKIDLPPVVVKKSEPPVKGKAADGEKDELLAKIGATLLEYDNKESNIPLNHEYWDQLNRYRSL